MFGDKLLPPDASQIPGRSFFDAHEGRGIRAHGRRIGVAFADAARREGETGEGRRKAGEGRDVEEGEEGPEMPRLQGPALARRNPKGRGQAIPMPDMREEILRHLRDLALSLEDHAGEDKVDRRDGDARLAGLGDRLDLPRRRQNRPVLEGSLPRRRRGLVEGTEAFRARLDRRDAIRPDAGLGVRRRGLGDLRRQDIEGCLHGGRLRLVGTWLLRGLPQARDAARALCRKMPGGPRRRRLEARPRRGPAPQRGDQEALPRRRLGEIRPGRQGTQGQDVTDEQPVLVPPLQLREAPRHQIRQARRVRGPLHVPAFPRPEIRPRGDDRLPFLEGLRHKKEPQLQGRIQENVDVVRIVYPLFAPIYVNKRNNCKKRSGYKMG